MLLLVWRGFENREHERTADGILSAASTRLLVDQEWKLPRDGEIVEFDGHVMMCRLTQSPLCGPINRGMALQTCPLD
jgi:hypothetical protein